MKTEKIPYEKIIFVCTNARDPKDRISCGAPGRAGPAIREALKKEVEKRSLKGRVRVCSSGCMDLCEKGPNIMVFDDKGGARVYTESSVEDMPRIIQAENLSTPL